MDIPDWLPAKVAEIKKTFPDWSPPEVIALWEEECLDRLEFPFTAPETHRPRWEEDSRQVDLTRDYTMGAYHRMLTRLEMREVWDSLNARSADLKSFALTAIVGFYGPVAGNGRTPAERGRWLAEVQEAARHLADLVECSDLDYFLIEEYRDKRLRAVFKDAVRLVRGQETTSESWPDLGPDSLSVTLHRLANAAPAKTRPAVLNRQGPEAHRAYFARTLTDHCRKHIGGPLRRIVAITAAVVLEDESITERQIRRLAPDPDSCA